MVAQNLFLCLLTSAIGGTAATGGRVLLTHLARQEKSGHIIGKDKKIKIFVAFAALMAMSNVAAFFAPWFGPVAIYWSAYVASRLLSNMLLVGFVLRHERFEKSAQCATIVVVTAVLLITVNGPEAQDSQDVRELILGNPLAFIWLAILASIYLVCISFFFFGKLSTRSPLFVQQVFLCIACCSSALTATSSKMVSFMDGEDYKLIRGPLIAITWTICFIWTTAGFVEAKYIKSLAQYVPLMTFGSILLNAITGIVVWQDYNVVISWPGYMAALFLLGLGVYLISDLDWVKVTTKEVQDYMSQMNNLREFFTTIEQDLSAARLEHTLNQHQLRILRSSMSRGVSDPELGNRNTSFDVHDLEPKLLDQVPEFTETETEASSIAPSSPRRPHSRRASLESIESIAQNFETLKNLVEGRMISSHSTPSFGDDRELSETVRSSTSSLSTRSRARSLCDIPLGSDDSYQSDFHRGFSRQSSSGLLVLSNKHRISRCHSLSAFDCPPPLDEASQEEASILKDGDEGSVKTTTSSTSNSSKPGEETTDLHEESHVHISVISPFSSPERGQKKSEDRRVIASVVRLLEKGTF